LTIGYYKKPEEILDSDGSYPDGATGCQHFEECIRSYALWKLYQGIEDGMEGQKVNTGYYKNEFYENLEELKDFCSRDIGPGTIEPGYDPFEIFVQ
jgi:hypothetical protein